MTKTHYGQSSKETKYTVEIDVKQQRIFGTFRNGSLTLKKAVMTLDIPNVLALSATSSVEISPSSGASEDGLTPCDRYRAELKKTFQKGDLALDMLTYIKDVRRHLGISTEDHVSALTALEYTKNDFDAFKDLNDEDIPCLSCLTSFREYSKDIDIVI